MTVWVEIDLCNGCERCARACPYGAVEVAEGKARILTRCTSCGACIEACKQRALRTDVTPRSVPDFREWKGVWVYAEQKGGRLHRVSLELLGEARKLACRTGEEVSAVLLGDRVSGLEKILFEHGAERVYLAEHRALKHYDSSAYTKVLHRLAGKHQPCIFLLGATALGRDLAPRLSRRLGAGLTADCTELSIDPEEGILLQTRPAFGGNVMATIVNRYSRPQMATVRPGVMEVSSKPGARGQVFKEDIDLTETDIKTRILEKVTEDKEIQALSEARVIVAGGRGVGNAAGFKILSKLANVLKGQLAGTRVAVEEGWVSTEQQVGQTGQSVRPELYIACGISGAVQHRAGMVNSRYVIAINKDRRAPIFEVADWGILGDLHEVVPELIRQLGGSDDYGR